MECLSANSFAVNPIVYRPFLYDFIIAKMVSNKLDRRRIYVSIFRTFQIER
nr:MAG TPA: hypothetical protein [Caudoviricetes sp.]